MTEHFPEHASNNIKHVESLLRLIVQAATKGDLGLAAARAKLAITHLEAIERYARTRSFRNIK